MILHTQLVVRHGDKGVPVTATRQQASWNFTWRGGGGSLLGVSRADAVRVALGLSERLTAMQPLKAALDDAERELGEWLDDQREPT